MARPAKRVLDLYCPNCLTIPIEDVVEGHGYYENIPGCSGQAVLSDMDAMFCTAGTTMSQAEFPKDTKTKDIPLEKDYYNYRCARCGFSEIYLKAG